MASVLAEATAAFPALHRLQLASTASCRISASPNSKKQLHISPR
jgi:hypothetical protein